MVEVNGTSQRTNAHSIPQRCDVAIIGGGPAGSAAATLLAKEGFDVVVFEKEKFPRPQVGESILPQIWKFFDLLGVSEKMMREHFLAKSGGIIVWDGKINQIRFTSFGYNDPDRLGLHVERDVFDDILLKHSAECGAQVFEEVMVSRVDFSDSEWPVVYYNDRRGGGFRQGGTACRYVIDASGHASVLARQFGTRKLVSEEVNYLGLWGYYRGVWYLGVDRQAHPPEDCYKVKPVTFINSFEDGWIWHIILRETTSVGLVVNRGQLKGMGKQAQERYLRETCANLPYLGELLAPGEFIEGSMFFRPDYSFYSDKVTGENFYCIGDAGAFVDPVFSQGVQAALFNGTLATWAISSSFKTPHRRLSYSKIAENMMMQYYGFSRLLALGDFGGEGVDPQLVQAMMRYLPTNELELALAAATTTSRSGNFHRMAREAGVFKAFGEGFGVSKIIPLEELSIQNVPGNGHSPDHARPELMAV